MRWDLTNMTYVGNRTQREVQYRYLAMSTGASELTYPISHDAGDSSRTFHYSTVLDDAGGKGEKAWFFQTDSTNAGFGLLYDFSERQLNPLIEKRMSYSIWTKDALNRPYISSSFSTLDPGSNQVQSRTDQMLDQFGNVTSMSLYDFGAPNAPTSPTRSYANTYLTDALTSNEHPTGSNYLAEHIHNRLLTSTVTQGGTITTLVNNKYDFYNPGTCGANVPGQSWLNSYPAGMYDPSQINNPFRGNVTTSYGLDMEHDLCYGTTGAVMGRTDGGHVTTTLTDSTTNYTAPTAITTGSLTNTLTWDPTLQLSSQTGPNGDTAGITYDSASRPQKTTTPYGAYTTYTYSTNPAQNTAVVTSSDPSTNGRKTVTKLYGLGRTIEVDSIDAGGTTRSIVQMQYAACGCSPLGKLKQKSQPYKPGDPIYWTVYNYDGLGRTLNVVAPDGASTTAYFYSGNTVKVTDAAGKWKTFTMDAFGNLTNVLEPDTSQTNTNGQATTTYSYDALNHLVGVSMPRRMPSSTVVTQTRTFNYLVGSTISAYLQSANNPENGTVSYTYNADGTLHTKLDMKGQTLKYAYDSYGRVLTVSLAGSPDTVLRSYT